MSGEGIPELPLAVIGVVEDIGDSVLISGRVAGNPSDEAGSRGGAEDLAARKAAASEAPI